MSAVKSAVSIFTVVPVSKVNSLVPLVLFASLSPLRATALNVTAPVAVSFPKESWIDSNIVKHINRKNLEGSIDVRGTALTYIGQMITEGKISLPSIMTISVTLFFNYTTSNYDRIEENKAHDKEVDKSRNNK